MSNLYQHIGEKIRTLRQSFGGKGISQDELAKEMETTANTISRWETGAYKPSAKDIYRLAQFFGVNIATFFPDMENTRIQALMSATGDLEDEDIDELTQYAQYRKARRTLNNANNTKRKK